MFSPQAPHGIGHTVVAAISGILGSTVTYTATFVENVEPIIRLGAMALGGFVSVLACVKLIIDIRKSLKK